MIELKDKVKTYQMIKFLNKYYLVWNIKEN